MSEATDTETVHGAPVTYSRGQRVVHVDREGYCALLQALRDDGFEMCVDLVAVDYLTNPHRELPPGMTAGRFEVVVSLLSLSRKERLRVRVQVPHDDPVIPSLFEIYPGTEAMEREAFDLMGVVFDDHPDLTRILMTEDWEGHPLRKDYSIGRIPVQFKAPPETR